MLKTSFFGNLNFFFFNILSYLICYYHVRCKQLQVVELRQEEGKNRVRAVLEVMPKID